MATNATKPTPGRMARAIHWFFPSRRQVAISLAADAVLAVLGLPLWMHLALGLLIHLVVALLD
jgi:hypothetical protein